MGNQEVCMGVVGAARQHCLETLESRDKHLPTVTYSHSPAYYWLVIQSQQALSIHQKQLARHSIQAHL